MSFDDEGSLKKDSIHKAWHYMSVIAKGLSRPKHEQDLFYIRGICRNRMYVNEAACIELLFDAHELGASIDELTRLAKESKNWTIWRREMYNLIDRL